MADSLLTEEFQAPLATAAPAGHIDCVITGFRARDPFAVFMERATETVRTVEFNRENQAHAWWDSLTPTTRYALMSAMKRIEVTS